MPLSAAAAELLPLLYAAVAEPGLWPDVLAGFTRAIHTRYGYFWISRLNQQRPHFAASSGVTDEIALLVARPDYRDPWMSRLDLNTVPVGEVMRSNEICPDEDLVVDEWYQRVCVPAGMHYGGGVMLERTATVAAGMSTTRAREAGPLTDEEVSVWQDLVPHFRAVVGVINRLNRIETEREALLRYFEDIGQGVVLVSASGEVAAINGRASEIATGGALKLSDGFLVAADAKCGERLDHAIRRTAYIGLVKPERIALKRDNKPRVLATVLPVGATGVSRVGSQAVTAVVYLTDLGKADDLDPAPLRELFQLTEAEARLTCRLAAGESLTEAAQWMNVSIHTVRSQLQRTLEKTGVGRQAELVLLALKAARRNSKER